MLAFELNRDTVQFVIDKAHEFHTRDDVECDDEPEIANTADYLIGTALLEDDLADGLDHFEAQETD